MEKIPFSNSKENNHSLQHQHSYSLIYCFICGIAYKQSHFISHYTECKNNYLTNPTYDNRPVQEPPNFEIFLTKIKKKEDLSSFLEEYNKVVEEIHFNLISKECPKCKKKFYPDDYLKHSFQCLRKRSLTEGDLVKCIDDINNNSSTNDTKQRKRRKMSMENLKSITKDEIKSFKYFNLLRYQNK